MNKTEFRASLMSKIYENRNRIKEIKAEQFEGDEFKYALYSHELIKKHEGIIEGIKLAWQLAELLDEQQTITEQVKQKLFGGNE